MDPRLKAYQKQNEPPKAEATKPAAPRPAPTATAPKWNQFVQDAAVPKTKAAPEAKKPDPTAPTAIGKASPDGDKSIRKVAKFLILLGQDEAAKVVRHLEASQIEAISHEIATIKKIDPLEAEHILKEFGYIAAQQVGVMRGGKAAAQEILDEAFGKERSKSILNRAVPETQIKPFLFLKDVEKEVLRSLLVGESFTVLSIVVPFLEKTQAAVVMKGLDPSLRLDLVKRLAKMEKVASEIVAKVEEGLREKLHNMNPATTEEIDGKSRLADILRHMSVDKEERILKDLDKARPELTEELRRRLFTPEHLVRVGDDGFEDILRAKTEQQLALLWLASHDELRAKIEKNISTRRFLIVQSEIDLLQETPRRELQKEMRFFLEEVREAVRSGKAALFDDTEEYV
ncbi:MAG: FliG C-terminal domain-containing protein [Spirochaetales bacterium]